MDNVMHLYTFKAFNSEGKEKTLTVKANCLEVALNEVLPYKPVSYKRKLADTRAFQWWAINHKKPAMGDRYIERGQ